MRIPLYLIISVLFFIPVGSSAFFGGSADTYSTVSDLTDAVASEMKGELKGKKLYLDRSDIRNGKDGSVTRFSARLANELERALSKAGFVLEGSAQSGFQTEAERQKGVLMGELADYRVIAGYSIIGDKLQVNIKVRENKTMTMRALKEIYAVPVSSAPELQDSLDNRIEAMVSRLLGPVSANQQQMAVYVPLILESRKKYASPFSEFVTSRVKALLSEASYLKVIDDTENIEKLKAARIVKRTSPELSSTGADALLEGTYLRSMKKSIHLSVALKDSEGRAISRADEEIPLDFVTYSLDNSPAESISRIADVENESAKGVVTIETSRKGSYQVYYEGDTVSFLLKVAKPLYVYMYTINSRAGVELLYPRPGAEEQPKTPGITYQMPDDSWEIQVTPPFGTDAVKVFASDRRLPLPAISAAVRTRSFVHGVRGLTGLDKVRKELSHQRLISGYDLVDWYKGVTGGMGAHLYESTIYIESRPRTH